MEGNLSKTENDRMKAEINLTKAEIDRGKA